MFTEEEIVPVSAIEHYSYCPRQCGLIHVEGVFTDNVLTLRGDRIHENVHEAHCSYRAGRRCEYGMTLWSDDLGLSGKADAVEFDDDGTPWPVEYKHGARAARRHDDLQLCAQGMCLEEMLNRDVPAGAIFYHKSRRWREVELSEPLREEVRSVVRSIREMLLTGVLPPPVADARCRQCSLQDDCEPALLKAAADAQSAQDGFGDV
ncbi:MAG: CRISPR-associated protein Cas4 [Aeromicrobium sp.]|nr:CRISPR-associated protein Cas4 [Aeromicrobium sp.]